MKKPKYKLETIPVWDALEKNNECFLCSLMKEAEQHGVDFYLGASVMNPETRVRVNNHGFCSHHFHMLSKAQKSQGLALICDTYLNQSKENFEKAFKDLQSSSSIRKLNKAITLFNSELEQREKGCLICTQMQKRLDRYLYTIVFMCMNEKLFNEALVKSKGFCLHHYKELINYAKNVLDSKEQIEFVKLLTELEVKNIERISADVLWLTQKHKSENKDKPFNGCEDAHKRTVSKMIGDYRVIDPIKNVK